MTSFKIKHSYMKLPQRLKEELSECKTVLDLGCGKTSMLPYCEVDFSVGVDLFDPYLEESKKKCTHNKYIKADITKIEFEEDNFDAVILMDVLEHLSTEDGKELLIKAKKWAKRKVIVFTPNGFVYQGDREENPLQVHKSGWKPLQLKKLGFKVRGVEGWKKLYGYNDELEHSSLKFGTLGMITADITRVITYVFPEHAFGLWAVWEKDK